ncbi:MAG TPA: glycoside hydrolase family 9 protein [Bacteroidota bacterium]|nr:glycoside hydrolase family 9 protein [Bacteroidota bacterium]
MHCFNRGFLILSAYCLIFSTAGAQVSSDIRYNQIGFYPSMQKIAVVRNASNTPFYIVTPSQSDTLVKGMLTTAQTYSSSGESVSIADFSDLKTPGTYQLFVPGVGSTIPFVVEPRVHLNLAIGALKGYYYQRASTPILPAYGGIWARANGHPDTTVLVHPSAATTQRVSGTIISCPRGWYDAGDYNKYVVNSGISTYTILSTYEWFPEFCDQLTTNIPESGNGIPDILNEALWNVRWLMTMQDPNDGGVYHKCTDANFDAFEMPWYDTQTRYVVQKSTASTLDFAAVMAQAARVTAKFSSALPGFSDSCKQAALSAWKWARQNPAVYFNQSQMNAQFSPAINTGEYGDGDVTDEFAWAAAELFVTTAQDSFLTVANPLSGSVDIPAWANVRVLGMNTFAKYSKTIAAKVDTNSVRSSLVGWTSWLTSLISSSPYQTVMGAQSWMFSWGSNSVAANQGMELLIAFRLTQDSSYLRAALGNLDYLLGRNATTYCFVTGFGNQSPQHIHHRISASDGIAAPIPGLLAGGPNQGRDDGVTTYPSTLPALSYTDDQNSYASNEIAINWNAPLVFLAIGLEAILSPNGLPTSTTQVNPPKEVPQGFALYQNFPNPFNPSTVIRYSLPVTNYALLKVYDILGREIATLVNERQTAGVHQVVFNASKFASGVYFYQLQCGATCVTKKLVLMK